jgi:hypothetical protein
MHGVLAGIGFFMPGEDATFEVVTADHANYADSEEHSGNR